MSSRPVALPVLVDRVPAALTAEARWVVWGYQYDGRRWAKVPRAKTNDPSTWTTFAEAVARYRASKCDGIGFALGDGWAGIDADHCIDDAGHPLDLYVDNLRATCAGAYIERSPSGTGEKVFGRAARIGFEIRYHEAAKRVAFAGARFFAVTGHGDGDPTTDLSPVIDVWSPVAPRTFDDRPAWLPNSRTGTENLVISVADVPDDELLDRARSATNGAKFVQLWGGDFSDYASQSEADLALCCMLAFWTQHDRERVDRLFQRSGLRRPKWDAPSYRNHTLDRALRSAGLYSPDPAPLHRRGPVTYAGLLREFLRG